MLIQAVELENVKSYDKTKVSFLPGVNAIVGHNGAGKSTLLEAIGFVLFDSLEYKQSEFMRAGAKSATAAVTFVSSLDDRPYVVQRRIGSGAYYYIYDPQLEMRLCEGKADVQSFLRQHLGVEEGADLPALFHDAVGVPQGTLTAAFLLPDGPRGDVFDSLLKVRDYERAWERLREPVSWLRTQRAELLAEISGMEGRLERLPGLKEAVAQREAALATAQRNLLAASEELVQVQQQRTALERVRSELVALETQVAQARQRQEEITSRLAQARQALAEAQEAARIVAEHQADAERYRTAQAEQAQLEQKQRRRSDLEVQRASAAQALALHEKQVGDVDQERAAIAQAEALVVELAPAVAEQAALEQALAEARQQQARLEDARSAAAQAESHMTRLAAQLAERQQGQGRAAAVEREYAALQEQIRTLRGQIQDCRDEMLRHENQAETLKEQTAQLQDVKTARCPVCEQPLSEGHRHKLLDRNTEQLQAMRAQYRTVKSALQAHERDLASQEKRAKQLQEELLRLPRAQEVEALAAELRRAEENHAAALAQVKQLSAAPGQVEALTKQLAALNDPRRRHAIAVEQAQRRAEVDQRRRDLVALIESKRAELDQTLAALSEFAGLDEQLDAMAGELQRCQAAYQAVLTNQRLAEALPARQDAVRTATDDLERQTAEVARLEAAHRAVAERFDADRYAQVCARGDALQGEIGGLRRELDLLQENQASDCAEIAELEKVEAALAESQARLVRLEEQETVLEAIRTTLRSAGPHMRAALIRQISDGAHQIFGEIMQDYSRRLVWNDDYSISLEVDGHVRQFAQLSGGEQMSAALAVRLSLLREMSAIDVAFFDEPTANLDEARREALARQILSVRGFQQIFVISHDDTFEQATQNLVRVERQNGVSRVLRDASTA